MNRRRFLQLAAGAGVTAATMAEVGFFAEFMAWVKRLPVWSIPKNAGHNPYQNYVNLSDLAVETTINSHVEAMAQELSYTINVLTADLLGDDFSTNALSHLSLRELATVYYDKKAIENLKNGMPFRRRAKK